MKQASRSILRVRAGLPHDRQAIASFTQNTFHWGDYLSDVWDDWTRERRAKLLVAELDQRVVGTTHIACLGEGEAWLEGVRVHPDYRRQGVARELICAAHEWASKAQCRVVRLETDSHNSRARPLFESFGYREILEYVGWKGKPRKRGRADVRQAERGDLEMLWGMWQDSRLRVESREIVPAAVGWRWWRMSKARMRHAIDQKNVWVTPHSGETRGGMIWRHDEDSRDLVTLLGSKRHVLTLIQTARAMTENDAPIFCLAPHSRRMTAWAHAANLSLDHSGLLIYELRL